MKIVVDDKVLELPVDWLRVSGSPRCYVAVALKQLSVMVIIHGTDNGKRRYWLVWSED